MGCYLSISEMRGEEGMHHDVIRCQIMGEIELLVWVVVR
jgi:hypothetical protein